MFSRMKIWGLAVLVVVAATGCERRSPASDAKPIEVAKNRKPQSAVDLIDGPQFLLDEVKDPAIFNAQTCPSYIAGWTDKLFGLPAKDIVPTTQAEIDALKTQGPKVLKTLFALRMALRDRLKDIDHDGKAPVECVDAVREGFRYVRLAEEILIEWLQRQGIFDKAEPEHFVGGFPHVLINSEADSVDIRPGDLMLIRGKATVSSMIARIGNEEGQFSHLAIVGQDAKGKLHLVESLIQYGAIITPMDKWKTEKNARIMLLRYPDAAVAKAAARAIYDVVAPRFDKKDNIHYDFAMNQDDPSEIFCAEVISLAFKLASKGAIKMPLHITNASKFRGTGFLESFSFTKESFFAPSDVEVDTRFDVVAEYKHWPLLRQVRMQDAVMASIFKWMIKRGDRFKGDAWLSGKAFMAKFLRQFGLLTEKLPTYMPVKTVKTTLQFEAVATALLDNLTASEAEFFRQNGYTHSFRELMQLNDQFRRKDCDAWMRSQGRMTTEQPPEKVVFSSFFNNGKSCE